MNVVAFVIACLLFIACIIVFILVIVLPIRQRTKPQAIAITNGSRTIPSGLNQSFQNEPHGQIQISDDVKPLALSVIRDGPIKNAYVFSRLAPVQTELTFTCRAFAFAVKEHVTITSLQVVDQHFASGGRLVGIFNVESTTQLGINTVSKTDDPLIQGFRTHELLISEQILLVPDTLYACVALLNPNDIYVSSTQDNVVLPALNILMDYTQDDTKIGFGRVGEVVSNSLTLPSTLTQVINNAPFASFQFQAKNVKATIFAVDTQYPRFPPRYAYGLNVMCKQPNGFFVTNGVCSSAYDDANLILSQTTFFPLNPFLLPFANTWYAVFIANNTSDDNNATSVFLSTNFAEIPFLRFRRIGYIRTKPQSSEVFLMDQQGASVRRTTFYLEKAVQATITTGNATDITLNVDLIPPSAGEVTLQIECVFLGPDLPPQSFSLLFANGGRVEFKAQKYQIQTITLPLTSSHIPFEIVFSVVIDNYIGASPTFTISVLKFVEDL